MNHQGITDRLGRPLQDLRISVTDECNFRCTYCMPKELFGEGHPFMPHSRYLEFSEILQSVALMVPLGVRKIKITGGEPLLRPGVHRLISGLRDIPGIEDVGLITNGFHMATLGKRLRDAGLQRVTISLDSLDPDTFEAITGRGGALPVVLRGIEEALTLGFDPVKVNMVVQRGVNHHQAVEMAQYFRNTGVELRFIEYMDVGRRNNFEPSLLVPNREIRDAIQEHWPLTPEKDAYFGEVADSYRYNDGAGRIGFISSMTQPFCRSCTRLRLSADGKLYRCLFSGIGLDLKALLRAQTTDTGAAQSSDQQTKAGETSDQQTGAAYSSDPKIEFSDQTTGAAQSSDQQIGAGATNAQPTAQQAIRRFWGIREDRYSELRAEPPGQANQAGLRLERPDSSVIDSSTGSTKEEPDSSISKREDRVEMYRMGG